MKTIAFLLLCACGSVPVTEFPERVECETDNGLLVLAPLPETWDCRSAQRVEDQTFKVFSHLGTADARFNYSMARTHGWRVVVHKEMYWAADGAVVSGQTDCPNRIIHVNGTTPNNSSFGHELAHAVQMCEPARPWKLDGDVQDFYHSNWEPIYRELRAGGLPP